MQIPVHISNADQLKELARTVVRHANNEHPMLQQSFDEFVRAGIDNPSYAKTILKGAQMDSVTAMAKDVADGYLSSDEYRSKAQIGAFTIDNLFTNTESGNKFNESFIKQHPKTWIKRCAVLKGLSEGTKCEIGVGDFVKCSKYKNVKIAVYKTLKRVAKHFKNNPEKIKTII